MPVSLQYEDKARQPLLAGAEKLAKAVVSTLGPHGRNVAIRRPPLPMQDGTLRHRPPLVTKDGVSVARQITSLPDLFEDMGAQMVKEAAERTNRIAGDGTTTATLLAYEMMREGVKLISEKANVIHLRRGMQKACEAVCKKLESMRREVKTIEEFKAIATISSQDEEIGSLVAMVIDEIGRDGAVQIEDGMGTGIEYEITSGMQVASGYAHHHFANQRNGKAILKNPYILVTTEKITSVRQILPLIREIKDAEEDAKEGGEELPVSLVIFSTGVEGDALTTLIHNLPHIVKDAPGLESLVLKPPFFGQRQLDVLEDIAACVGARLIDGKTGRKVETMQLSDLGRADSVIADPGICTVIGLSENPAREKRVDLIKSAQETAETDADRDFLAMRLANATGKIAKIKVGGSSQQEQQEKKHRVEDAICATRAAHETGILPGGGVAYLRCVNAIKAIDLKDKDERQGALLVLQALAKQLWWVARNAGEEADQVVLKVMDMPEFEGYNAETGQYGDMFDMRVIDPTKVPVTALKNAVSVASMFLTTEVVVSEELAPPSA